MRTNRVALVGVLGACLAAAAPSAAQGKGKQQQGPQDEPTRPPPMPGGGGPNAEVQRVIMEQYYLPEMVRDFSEELKLTDDQVDRLRKATSDARTETDQLEWDVSRENRKLAKLLRDGATKEQVYAQMDVVFSFENKIKKKMLGLLIVVRDVLTKQQRDQLDKLKADWDRGRGGPGMGGHGGPGMGDCPMMRGARGGGSQGFPPGPPPEGFPPGPPATP